MTFKRLIFTLLYDDGFVLSRNFRLQRVGDLRWLRENYNFARIGFSIDELIVLNVSRSSASSAHFQAVVAALNDECFAPIAAGGWISSVDDARRILGSGADKVVLNSLIATDEAAVERIAREFGAQCIVASIDLVRSAGSLKVAIDRGRIHLDQDPLSYLRHVSSMPIGEIYVNSIDRDGTGDGYDEDLLRLLDSPLAIPMIIAGGVGTPSHLSRGLAHHGVDAVATAHLHNFVGDGLERARIELRDAGHDLPVFSYEEAMALRAQR